MNISAVEIIYCICFEIFMQGEVTERTNKYHHVSEWGKWVECLGASISFAVGVGKIGIKPKHMYPIRAINACIKKTTQKK